MWTWCVPCWWYTRLNPENPHLPLYLIIYICILLHIPNAPRLIHKSFGPLASNLLRALPVCYTHLVRTSRDTSPLKCFRTEPHKVYLTSNRAAHKRTSALAPCVTFDEIHGTWHSWLMGVWFWYKGKCVIFIEMVVNVLRCDYKWCANCFSLNCF